MIIELNGFQNYVLKWIILLKKIEKITLWLILMK
jgi:hypothetical protein